MMFVHTSIDFDDVEAAILQITNQYLQHMTIYFFSVLYLSFNVCINWNYMESHGMDHR